MYEGYAIDFYIVCDSYKKNCAIKFNLPGISNNAAKENIFVLVYKYLFIVLCENDKNMYLFLF